MDLRVMNSEDDECTGRGTYITFSSNSDEELSGSATMVRFTMLSTGVMTSVHTSSVAATAILAAYFPTLMQESYEACGISTRLKMNLRGTS
jgi:hypothetical protein